LSTYNVIFAMHYYLNQLTLLSFPTRRSSDLSSKLMPGPPQCLTGLSFELCVEWSTAHTRAISFGNTNHLTNLRWRYTQATADAGYRSIRRCNEWVRPKIYVEHRPLSSFS